MLLWLEVRSFNNQVLLVEGGLLDQPDWVWQLVTLAGATWQEIEREQRQLQRALERQKNKGLVANGQVV